MGTPPFFRSLRGLAGACAYALLVALFFGGSAAAEDPAPADGGDPEITRRELKAHVKVLAADDWEGREAGEPGSEKAADYVAAEFARLGLKPLGVDGTFFQPFTSPKGTKVLPTCALEAFDASGNSTEFKLAEDFTPVDTSAAGTVDAAVVFAGYGICAPTMGYDDYEGLDVQGKVVLVLRHAPRWEDKRKSPFATQQAMLAHGTFKAKADAAAAKGAAALIVVNDPASTSKSDDELQLPGGSTTGKIPVLHMTWQAAKRLGSRIDLPFVRRQRAIDARIAPNSEVVADARIRLVADLAPDIRHMKNICALLEPGLAGVTTGDAGTPTAVETVIIGAHYDHVGRGRFGSLANADGKIHNGADDNASGTTALMEIAGWLVSQRALLKRRVLFIAFSGEELGLLGSKHYVSQPVLPLSECTAMLNLDMVGRLEKNRLFVGGTGTSPIWPEMLERQNKKGRFELTSWPGGKAPSDHASFYDASMPVLFFFTGLHGDYHRPSDDWNTLEYAGHERVARFAAEVAFELATEGERPQFTKCDAGGFAVGPFTGLSVEQREGGVFVAHVDKRSPASQAGFKEEDKILEWEGAAVGDTGAWNDRVSQAKPGDKVIVTVERGGRERKLTLKLGST
ncbi:MAG: M28 family peptidase [Planctomycetota bacterium]|nr:M28 family peptidase [Planctomycetota bacterium]